IVRRGLRALLEAAGHEVCAEAATGREAVALAAEKAPHVAVLDVSMPDLNGLEAARQIKAERPDTEVLIVTAHETEQVVRDVLSVGARGYVLKSDAVRDIVAAVEALQHGRTHFTSRVAELVLSGFLEGGAAPAPVAATTDAETESASAVSRLTAREREVLQHLAE